MTRSILGSILLLILAAAPAFAAEEGALFEFRPDTDNTASLQRGARDFMNYCSGCHSLKYLRYNRLGADLGVPDKLLQDNLMFTGEKSGDPILSAMPSESEQWFGKEPPDLTLTARQRGPDWIYSYLLSFYLDPARPTGVNNLMLPNAAMPDVLWPLQGWQKAVYAGKPSDEKSMNGGGEPQQREFERFEIVSPGSQTPEQFHETVADLANFLTYAAEPGRNDRVALGLKVIAYLLVLFVLAWLLKHEYWKDVH